MENAPKINRENLYYKEIDLLQGCLNRMSHDSFLIKGWALSVVLAVVSLLPTRVAFGKPVQVCVCIITIVAFMVLDLYYNCLERGYRKKYEWVVKYRMKSDFMLLDLNPWTIPAFENGFPVCKKLNFFRNISAFTLIPYVVYMLVLSLILLQAK